MYGNKAVFKNVYSSYIHRATVPLVNNEQKNLLTSLKPLNKEQDPDPLP